jgi:ADP-heptose:LPS heptosyltransferase
VERLILQSLQSPGDIVMLTAAVRDLHRAYPGRFQTDVRTSADALFENNPWITRLSERERGVQTLTMHYPLIHESNQRPYHFLHGYVQFLEQQLDLRIPLTEFNGDIHLSAEEKNSPPRLEGVDLPERFWIMVAGGKYDFTAKWWNPASYQAVVDHFQGRLQFVQCGEQGHWHPPLRGVMSLIGRTSLREFVRLMHFADGVVCPVTFAMHLSAAVECREGQFPRRPCVVIAGGREPPHWEAYPSHQFISTVGMLSCCATGGCWKSRCQLVRDGDAKDRHDLCERPVQVTGDLVIPRCLDMISPNDVIRRIEMYLSGSDGSVMPAPTLKPAAIPNRNADRQRRVRPAPRSVVLQLDEDLEQILAAAIIRNHLQRYHPDWQLAINHASRGEELSALLDIPLANGHMSAAPAVWNLNGAAFNRAPSLHWPNLPVADWLLQTLKLSPIEDLFQCRFHVNDAVRTDMRESLQRLLGDGKRFVLIDGLHRSDLKAWDSEVRDNDPSVRAGCLVWSESGDVLATLQFANEEPPLELRSLQQLVALMGTADVFVGIETPSLALASGSRVPTVALWRTRHPVRVLPAVPHMRHVVSGRLESMPLAPAEALYFASKYHRQVVNEESQGVIASIHELLVHEPQRSPSQVNPEPPDSPTDTADSTPATVACESNSPLRAVRFYHGLGDAANFARLIPLYTRRGHRIGVECTSDKEILFRAAGAETVPGATDTHDWGYPPHDVHGGHGRDHQGSKIGWNISVPPLPDIGDKAALWDELCRSEVRVPPLIPEHESGFVRRWLKDLPKPIVLLHTIGNTNQSIKSLPDAVTRQLYREILDRCNGTLVLLDWDNRVPRLATFRVRHLNDMSGGCNTARLFALMDQSNLMIGVDSGPLHAAGLTDIARVGLWMPGHYAARYSLPHSQQLNLVLAQHTERWNKYRRVPWNIVEQPGAHWDAAWIAEQCVRMLEPPQYLSHSQRGIDVQLQHWIQELCRGQRRDIHAAYTDRNRSFDLLLREATARFEAPVFVETGTIRAEEDWVGAGFSTYLFGSYLRARGGRLHSVDLSPEHCRFAKTWTAVYGDTVQVHERDSIGFLQEFTGPMDVLYLDSLDTTEPGHAEHALREAEVAMPKLHERSLLLIDDTYWREGAFCGKGALAVPWLVRHGFRILYAGYQVLLTRSEA